MNVSVILGTRPEGVKLAPVIRALKADPRFVCRVCSTGQHREMLDQIFSVFGISPDVDLGLMRPNQTLPELTARAITAIDQYLAEEKPDAVMVQGDTTTVFAGALAAFYNKIPVAHVEAGLRTGNLYSPWPEEANRLMTTRLTHWHLAPTPLNRQNLLDEGVDPARIFVTGNTVIDALHLAIEKIRTRTIAIPGLLIDLGDVRTERRMVLITGHRRENFGDGFQNICRAIAELAETFKDVDFVYPVHLNPNVRGPVEEILGGIGHSILSNVYLIEPQSYLPFVALMNRADVILTDSGGVQEEAPSLGKPVLVMRDTTERPEAVTAGTVRLVGTDRNAIVQWVTKLLMNRDAYESMAAVQNPYGDGLATQRILNALLS